MYFDAVLKSDYTPVFNGTPEETRAWINGNKARGDFETLLACVGKTLAVIPIKDYLSNMNGNAT